MTKLLPPRSHFAALDLLFRLNGGIDDVSALTDRDGSTLYKMRDPSPTEPRRASLTLPEIADLERRGAHKLIAQRRPVQYPVTGWLAAEAGGTLVIPSLSLTDAELLRMHGEATQEFGTLTAGIGKALADDGRIAPAEAAGLLLTLDRLVDVAASLRERMRDRASPLTLNLGDGP